MLDRPVVFVSSTSDLKGERAALAEELKGRYAPYFFEEDRARRQSPRSRCRRVIGRCDVFVGVHGPRRGSELSDGRSVVEWERDVALEREDLPAWAWLTCRPDDPAVEERQRPFLEVLVDFDDGQWCGFAESPEALAEDVRASLNEWLVEVWAEVQARGARLRTWLLRWAVGGGLLAAAVPLALLVPAVRNRLSTEVAVLGCLLAGLAVAGGTLLLRAEIGGRRDG